MSTVEPDTNETFTDGTAAMAPPEDQTDRQDPAPTPQMAIVAPQVKVDNRSRRHDNDALEGGWCQIIAGENAGVYGTFDEVNEYAADGYPVMVSVVARDGRANRITVPYKDIRPAESGHR